MTTILYDRPTKTLATDSRNTDSSGQVFMCNKIEKLDNEWYFMGSGHCLTIDKVKQWARLHLHPDHRPDFEELFGECAEDFGMSCLIISPDGNKVLLVDDEMTPVEVLDDIVAVGSGGPWARAARAAGATPERAVEIAIMYDGNSGGPVQTFTIA